MKHQKYFAFQRLDGTVRVIRDPEDDLINDLKASIDVWKYYGPYFCLTRAEAEVKAAKNLPPLKKDL